MAEIAELSRTNPRLLELEAEYAKLNLFEQSVWTEWAKGIDIQNFRAEHGYMAQMWMMTEERYQNTLDHALSIGLRHDIETLGEDGAFGAITFRRDMGASEDDIIFSRDLLDSVFEIDFLRKVIGVPPSVLDIGAGYGRLLHRLSQNNPAGMYIGIDGVPLSTFLCEFYVKYRTCENSTLVVPLNEYGSIHRADLAMNIQSFSEMPYSAVKFWLDLCADLNIKHFFLSPHSANLVDAHFVTSEPDGGHKDYYPLFAEHGYQETRRWHKFPPDWSKPLIFNTEFVMFKRG